VPLSTRPDATPPEDTVSRAIRVAPLPTSTSPVVPPASTSTVPPPCTCVALALPSETTNWPPLAAVVDVTVAATPTSRVKPRLKVTSLMTRDTISSVAPAR
jgi:hypothetical protein